IPAQHTVYRCPQHRPGMTSGGNEPAAGRDQIGATARRFIGAHIRDQTEGPSAAAGISKGIIDPLRGTKGTNETRVSTATHPGHPGAERAGNLYRESSHSSGGANNQHFTAGPCPPLA